MSLSHEGKGKQQPYVSSRGKFCRAEHAGCSGLSEHITWIYFSGHGDYHRFIWAHYAWGSYWSWDSKEIWSLITWLIYAIMLHARFVRGWRGRRMAIMTIVGFVSVLFTYLGVNFLTSLHNYI
ncbi:MAG TPA: cytochrome c biogenesis protein CcsA [Smithellaceae bacterium]|nr:cytochrome c biogenesis protein CcsA [Smithellaceae bacterium]